MLLALVYETHIIRTRSLMIAVVSQSIVCVCVYVYIFIVIHSYTVLICPML